jgi:NAD(P)H dehydrogenase (quinone)
MTIVVTGATGRLGRLTVEALRKRGVPADSIRALGRSAERLALLAAQGIQTAVIDFDKPETLEPAFAGADAMLLVSSSEIGQRVRQHGNAIEAAKRAGVGRLVYTSVSHATEADLVLAPEHAATERLLAESGLPVTILRNNLYTDSYADQLGIAAATGEIVASVGAGLIASASRRDYAEAAAVVLTTEGHEGAVYELTGDVAWTFAELAAVASDLLGREIVYRPVTSEEYRQILLGVGLDEGSAGFVVALDGDIRNGGFAEVTSTLSELIGRPTTPLAQGLADARTGAVA